MTGLNDNRSIFPATSQDRMNYLLGLYSADQQISLTLTFKSRLDESILEKAIQHTLKHIPILNSRFIESESPYWEKLPSQRQICVVVDCSDEELETKVMDYLAEPWDRMNGPQIQVKIFRTLQDTLCLKISHLCSDGTGLKEYVAMLADIYTQVQRRPDSADADPSDEIPSGFRDPSHIFKAIGITDPETLFRQPENEASLWSFPSNPAHNEHPRVVIQRLDRNQTKSLLQRAKTYEATVNDLLLTAYFPQFHIKLSLWNHLRRKKRSASRSIFEDIYPSKQLVRYVI